MLFTGMMDKSTRGPDGLIMDTKSKHNKVTTYDRVPTIFSMYRIFLILVTSIVVYRKLL